MWKKHREREGSVVMKFVLQAIFPYQEKFVFLLFFPIFSTFSNSLFIMSGFKKYCSDFLFFNWNDRVEICLFPALQLILLWKLCYRQCISIKKKSIIPPTPPVKYVLFFWFFVVYGWFSKLMNEIGLKYIYFFLLELKLENGNNCFQYCNYRCHKTHFSGNSSLSKRKWKFFLLFFIVYCRFEKLLKNKKTKYFWEKEKKR